MFNRSTIFRLLLFALLSCQPKEHSPQPVNGTSIDKNAFISSLTVPNRYWRIEELRIKAGNSVQNINFFPFTNAVNSSIAGYVVPKASFHFESTIVEELICSGPYGNTAYPTLTHMAVTYLGLTNDGSWKWDDDRQTVELKLPGMISSIISSASRSQFLPTRGYLDNKIAPRLLTLSQAQNATEPERISIVVEESDTILGKIYYNLILRSSWIVERDGGSPKEPFYKVHY